MVSLLKILVRIYALLTMRSRIALLVILRKHRITCYMCFLDCMVLTLVTQAVFVILLLLCPWVGLADFMKIEVMKPTEPEHNLFRVYLLLIPVLHLILAITIEVNMFKLFTTILDEISCKNVFCLIYVYSM